MHGSFYCLDISEIEKAFGINFIKITFSWRRRRIWVRVWVSYLLPLKVESWELFEIAINAIELFFLISKVIGIKCNNLKMLFNKKVLIFSPFLTKKQNYLLNYLAKGNYVISFPSTSVLKASAPIIQKNQTSTPFGVFNINV